MSNWMGLTILGGDDPRCPQRPSRTAAMIEDKTYGDPAAEDDPYKEEGGQG